MPVSVKISGLDKNIHALSRLRSELDKMNDLLGDVGNIAREELRKQFDSEGTSYGAGWKKLAPRTIAERAKLGYGPKPILKRKGTFKESVANLFSSYHHQENKLSPGKAELKLMSSYKISDARAGARTRMHMVTVHNKGWSNPVSKGPARQILFPKGQLPEPGMTKARKKAFVWFVKKLRRSGIL